ncbi:glutathione S-transferase family protein [Thermomonas flagellata]|uniref:glutathione S-transferase family protein n=1 Tax=Thermomonas flagellata TaxID=2888524 RepID=UPI001F03D3D7|nr:glutathione S-transferase family protein [Thermomonas flagellata]
MDTTLYYSPGAASLLVHWLLLELDVPHALQRVDFSRGEQKAPAFLALNPHGTVPVLVVDGVARHEAAAIALWLAEQHPQAGLAPVPGDPRRADYLQWMFELANVLQPLFRQWWYPAEPAGEACTEAVRAHCAPRIEACWERIDARLAAAGPYLLGEAPSVPDFYLTMLMRWARHMPRPATAWPALAALAARMKARPSFAALYAREGLAEWA